MMHRIVQGVFGVACMTLFACSQQSASVAAQDTAAPGTSTGELACDEYLTLARGCVEKGRLGAIETGRRELVAVERELRAFSAGAPLRLDPAAVWSSAVRLARDPGLRHDLKEKMAEALPRAALCKQAIDQLPTDCR